MVPNGIRVSTRELYDLALNIKDEVAELRRAVDSALTTNADLARRVRALELRFYGILAGLVGAVVVLAKIGGFA